jgi:hypothetical protein
MSSMPRRGGPVLELYRSLIAELLRSEIQAGRAATADPDRVAEVIAAWSCRWC